MNKAEREALELRNTVRLLEAELERSRLAGETAAPNLDQSANIAQIHALEKQLEGIARQTETAAGGIGIRAGHPCRCTQRAAPVGRASQQYPAISPVKCLLWPWDRRCSFWPISNNLPIFTDELARARKEYDELQKSGKKGTPVRNRSCPHFFPGRRP